MKTSIIIPTLNEAKNIPILISKIDDAMKHMDYEIIVVDDDSDDKTWDIADKYLKKISKGFSIRRMNGNGLSGAVVEGMAKASGNYLVVMDGDLQHDEKVIPNIIYMLEKEGYEICVCSRNLLGKDGYGDLNLIRKLISKFAIFLFKKITKKNLSDPVSGFFGIKKSLFNDNHTKINATGFKILLEFIRFAPSYKITEISYVFKKRIHGQTKFSLDVTLEYLLALIDLRFGWLIPVRFVKFGIIGFLGSLINYFSFVNLVSITNDLLISAVIAVQIGITWSYFGNNFFTFSEQRFKGIKLFIGLFVYAFFSIYGMAIQFLIADSLLNYLGRSIEYLTYLIYAIAVLGGSIINFLIHTNLTWRWFGKSFKIS